MPAIDLNHFRKVKAKTKSTGYRMTVRAGGRGEIYLYGVVGETFFSEGVTAKQFADDLKALGNVSAIDLRINSEGGDVFQGRTIYTLLKEHKADITVHVDGLAASIASLIAMAGDTIIMGEGTFMMIHNPWTGMFGNANDLRQMADLLDTIGNTMIDTYVGRTGAKRADIVNWLNAETWMPADEAKARGFADQVTGSLKVAACVEAPFAFQNMPKDLHPTRIAALKAQARIATMLKKS